MIQGGFKLWSLHLGLVYAAAGYSFVQLKGIVICGNDCFLGRSCWRMGVVSHMVNFEDREGSGIFQCSTTMKLALSCVRANATPQHMGM